MDAIAEKQRKKEMEIEERQRQREMEERERNSAPPDKYRTPARTGGADSWREREKQKVIHL